jgi:hypothetical protein
MAPGHRLVLNPGSVGCPIFADNPQAHLNNARSIHARYAIATKRNGRWSASLHAIDYDWDAAAAQARKNGQAVWAQSLIEGRVTR